MGGAGERRKPPLQPAVVEEVGEFSAHVTAHTLRHTAATWLRQERGDTRLVAE
ncbi:MAG: hypothetical protein ACRDNG_13110 [Gaiellaceae bacterium]